MCQVYGNKCKSWEIDAQGRVIFSTQKLLSKGITLRHVENIVPKYRRQVNLEQGTQGYLDKVALRLPGSNPSIYSSTKYLAS